jgi:2-aminoadipate transaminase
LEGNAIREIFKLLADKSIISFAGGWPALDALPAADIARLAGKVANGAVIQYGATDGMADYLEAGLKYVARRGVVAARDNIIAVSGGQQGIDLLVKAFVNKGDVVLVEDPTYLAVLHILKSYEANPVGVSSGANGIDIADLEQKIVKFKPKMLYLVPTFSNPTGVTLSAEKRAKIAEITAKYGVIVLEDDPYAELRYSGEAVPALKSFDKAGNIVYVTSFSKIISPGLRAGLTVADPAIIRKLTIGKQATDVHTSNLSQAIVAEYLKEGGLSAHLSKIIPAYKAKRDAMLGAMDKYFPKSVQYTRPEGGMFIFCRLTDGRDAKALLMEAVKSKVAYVPGTNFYADGSGADTFRLNFSSVSVEQIEAGIKALGSLI